MNFSKDQKGFSLIELMVVVAIIGILATIAVPQVNKFIAKSKQSEAKSNLSALYTANKAFFGEYNGYTVRFTVMGYAPEGRLRYNVGFAADAAPITTAPAYNHTAIGTATEFDSLGYCAASTACTTLAEAVAVVGTSCSATAFTAAAAGQIISGGANVDRWTLDNNRTLVWTSNGID